MGAFCSAMITETNIVASVRNILQAVEFLNSAHQQPNPKGRTLCPSRLSCQGSSRRTSAARTWGYRSSKNRRSSYTSTQPDLQWNSRSYVKLHNVFHPQCRCTRSQRTLTQPLVPDEPDKSSQTGCVPDTTPPGWQENVCSASPTPSTQPGAHLVVHVSPVRDCAKFSVPKMCKRLLSDSHKKICGTFSKWLYPDTQLTAQISPTNFLEQSSLVPSTVSGVTHTPSPRVRASAPRALLKELVVAHCSLSCDKRLQSFEEIGMVSVVNHNIQQRQRK